tara:strand:+ start:1325 stop:1681 length:357 start_codon:yes stop_codon:yes gene_type:complete
MAKIIEINIPDEYKNKNKYEIYAHLEQIATYAHNLKLKIEDLEAEVKLRDSKLQKQRADILKLKSLIGHQNIKINDLELQSVVEEAEYEEIKTPSFLPPSVIFETVKGKLPNQPIEKK